MRRRRALSNHSCVFVRVGYGVRTLARLFWKHSLVPGIRTWMHGSLTSSTAFE